MKKILLFSLLAFFLFTHSAKSQSCFSVAAGNDTTISCLQTCLDLKARIPDVRTTDDYQVVSIPYQPFPFTNPGGILVDPSYQDDQFSPIITLPFTFCYYGANYNSLVVGTNGVISFDVSLQGGFNDYVINAGVPIPNATYPRATIMGPFHDIDPNPATTSPQQPDRKMEYIIVGTAPCRKFVLNFHKVPYYDCPAELVTQQIVLYEGTGIIDMFLRDKPFACGTSTNNGRAIMGIQNWNQDLARAVPGRNNAVWNASNEGWRFVPSGTTSLLDSVALYKNGAWMATGTTVALGNGELEATFSPVCQSEDSMSYVVRAFYRQCDNPAIQTEGSDTMIVRKTLNPILTTIDSARCNGGLGKITVTSPVAPNIEYSIDGGTTWQLSPVFNVLAGNYTVNARVVASLCGGFTSVTVYQSLSITAASIITDASCANNDGIIEIAAAGGNPGYEYSKDNGVTYQPANQFLNLSVGTYNNLIVRDAYGCMASLSGTIALIDTMRLELGADSTICFGTAITLIPQTNALTDTFKWTPRATLNFDTVRTPIATPTDTTKYYLIAKWGLCTRNDSITINVLHKPIANAGRDTTVCYKTNATLFGSATNLSGTVNFAWSPPDSLTSPNTAVTGVRLDTTRQFTLTVTDNYGCNFSVTDSVIVTMQPQLVAFAGNDTNAILGRQHQLLGTGRNATDFVWSPAGPLNNPFIANPQAIIYNDTYFYVHITDAIGCTDDDTIFVKAYEGPTYYLPNALTPNGDGLNDVFFPTPVGISSTEYFRVFDRFGSLMYQTRAWMKGWDGTLKGKPASSGTYVWMIKGIDKNGSVVEMKGTVILLR
ncbi:MAG: gliding motility-associated C-terminal domain-containing protein [Chitinophagaceae bacterium]|nr:gliding motility-associated C-terminal domain-containing protein [Chitinophagaceae bacterium]